jgi:hypothetical protein
MSEVPAQGTTVRIESVKVKQAAAITPSTRSIANDQHALAGSCFLGHDKKGSKRAVTGKKRCRQVRNGQDRARYRQVGLECRLPATLQAS